MPGAAQPSLEMLAAPMLNNGAMPPGIRCEPKRSVTVLSSQQTGGGAPQLVLHGTETGLPPKQVCYLLIDTTGDGQMDALLSDSDGDGRADTLVLDTNGDGVADTAIPCVVIDTTGDGKADVLIVDTTNDGQADTIIRILRRAYLAPCRPLHRQRLHHLCLLPRSPNPRRPLRPVFRRWRPPLQFARRRHHSTHHPRP